jgi:undecaprenyl phosphate-alpha-L-ara4N flippase subunit ArnE
MLDQELEPQMNADERRLMRVPVGLFVVLMVLDTSVFVLDKVASQRAMVVSGPFYLHVVLQPWIWMAFALGPAQLFVWTRILKRIDLSLAYPLTTISYLATMVVSEVVFKETLGMRVWVGAMLIMAGVAVLGGSHADAPCKQGGL